MLERVEKEKIGKRDLTILDSDRLETFFKYRLLCNFHCILLIPNLGKRRSGPRARIGKE
jgi:hypothetical protein